MTELKYGLCPDAFPHIKITPDGMHIKYSNRLKPITPQSYTIVLPDGQTEVSLEDMIEGYLAYLHNEEGHKMADDDPPGSGIPVPHFLKRQAE